MSVRSSGPADRSKDLVPTAKTYNNLGLGANL